MSAADVFVPSDGKELLARSAIGEGYRPPVDAFKKTVNSRPSTSAGGYRFGQLSHNSFFTRHNPHPVRVKHLKGLLDVPICAVNDDGYFSNPRYSLQFPPNQHNQKRLQRLPVNAINVNSQLYPINTVTGLQYFTGLQSHPFREKAIPRVGMVPVTEAWRDELKALTDAIKDYQPEKPAPKSEPERPKTQYSETTGRLIPPPSRAMSRGASRQASRQGSRGGQRTALGALQHIMENPDIETVVLTMLCQILQTEDINAVQAWLCSAGEREKAMVMEMIHTAMASQQDYYQRDYQPEFIEENKVTKLPPINEKKDDGPKFINRLTVDDSGNGQVETWSQEPVQQIENMRPATSDAFRRPSSRPMSQKNGRVTPKPATPKPAGETTLRYTTSAQGNRVPSPGAMAPALATTPPPPQPVEQESSQNTF